MFIKGVPGNSANMLFACSTNYSFLIVNLPNNGQLRSSKGNVKMNMI